jgi:hypothetical protein
MNISSIGKPFRAGLVGIIAVLAAGSVAAVTPATRTEFEGFIHFCSSGPPDTVKITPGENTAHIRGATNNNQWVTGNPLIDGVENNVVLINFSPVSGIVRVNVTLEPTAYPGSTWEITQTIHLKPDGSVPSMGVGHGTGALHGMTIKFNSDGMAFPPNPCNAALPSGLLDGIIISPASDS